MGNLTGDLLRLLAHGAITAGAQTLGSMFTIPKAAEALRQNEAFKKAAEESRLRNTHIISLIECYKVDARKPRSRK